MLNAGDWIVDRISGIRAEVVGPSAVKVRDGEPVVCVPVRVKVNGQTLLAYIATVDAIKQPPPPQPKRPADPVPPSEKRAAPVKREQAKNAKKSKKATPRNVAPGRQSLYVASETAEEMYRRIAEERERKQSAARIVAEENRRIWRLFYPDIECARAGPQRSTCDDEDDEDWRPTFLRPIRVPAAEEDTTDQVSSPAHRLAWGPTVAFPFRGVRLSDECLDEFTLIDVPSEDEPREARKVTPAALRAWHRTHFHWRA